MQFGIMSVSDVTRNPVTGETPSEADRIKGIIEIAKKTEEVGLDVFAVVQAHEQLPRPIRRHRAARRAHRTGRRARATPRAPNGATTPQPTDSRSHLREGIGQRIGLGTGALVVERQDLQFGGEVDLAHGDGVGKIQRLRGEVEDGADAALDQRVGGLLGRGAATE